MRRYEEDVPVKTGDGGKKKYEGRGLADKRSEKNSHTNDAPTIVLPGIFDTIDGGHHIARRSSVRTSAQKTRLTRTNTESGSILNHPFIRHGRLSLHLFLIYRHWLEWGRKGGGSWGGIWQGGGGMMMAWEDFLILRRDDLLAASAFYFPLFLAGLDESPFFCSFWLLQSGGFGFDAASHGHRYYPFPCVFRHVCFALLCFTLLCSVLIETPCCSSSRQIHADDFRSVS